jgi:hypothetical protein
MSSDVLEVTEERKNSKTSLHITSLPSYLSLSIFSLHVSATYYVVLLLFSLLLRISQ